MAEGPDHTRVARDHDAPPQRRREKLGPIPCEAEVGAACAAIDVVSLHTWHGPCGVSVRNVWSHNVVLCIYGHMYMVMLPD